MALTQYTNSYVTVDEADDYMDTRIDSANWFSTDFVTRESALVTASLLVDNNPWVGSAVSSTQALAWPRNNAIYADDRMGATITIASTDKAPTLVKKAVYEQALHLIDNEDLLQGKTQTFESISVGSISISDGNNDTTRTPIKSPFMLKAIRPLIVRGKSGIGSGWWRFN